MQLAFIKKIKIAAFWHHIDAHLKWNDSLIHQQKKWFTWKEFSNVCPASEKKTRLWWICGYGMRKLYVFWTMRDYNSISSMSVSILNIMAFLDRIFRCFLPSVTSFLSIDLPFLLSLSIACFIFRAMSKNINSSFAKTYRMSGLYHLGIVSTSYSLFLWALTCFYFSDL